MLSHNIIPASAGLNDIFHCTQFTDDDEIVVIEEVTSAEACRLSHCYWNGAHVPGCLRFYPWNRVMGCFFVGHL